MPLNTQQKRGSAVNVSMPFRAWVLVPTGSINAQSERLVLLKMCSAVGSQPPPPAGEAQNASVLSFFGL